MKSVLFLLRNNIMTGRRFVLVARQLEKQNIHTHFLLFTNKSLLDLIIKDLELGDWNPTSIICYSKPALITKIRLGFAKISAVCRLMKNRLTIYQKQCPVTVSNDYSLDANILNHIPAAREVSNRIFKYYNNLIDSWNSSRERARTAIQERSPSAVVYDIEAAFEFLPVLSASRSLSVPIISMQHVEGFGKQYSTIPSFADFYIAYSLYNVENIKSMGVDESHIFLTGVPDTDIIYNYDKDSIRNKICNELRLSPKKQTILVALRPNYIKTYSAFNDLLIEHVKTVFNNSEYQIIIKPHCHDPGMAPDYQQRYCIPESQNIVVANRDYPLSKLLLLSDYLVTFKSSSIVESVMMHVPTIVIDVHENGYWPSWHLFNVCQFVEFNEIQFVLLKLKNKQYQFKVTETDRQRFVEYFRYKFDNQATFRIAEAMCSVVKRHSVVDE